VTRKRLSVVYRKEKNHEYTIDIIVDKIDSQTRVVNTGLDSTNQEGLR